MSKLLPQVNSDDVLEFGLIPELVGRLPVVSSLTPLDHNALVRVLTEPKNALIKQYQRLFQMENAELHFSEEALKAIAIKAQEKDTGARGLRSIVEEAMLDIMYELPERGPGNRYTITKDVIDGKREIYPLVEPKAKIA
jgi:ATP-dependent Clp protease ATP-binding subunit ClpX